jgi:hypothetical protein
MYEFFIYDLVTPTLPVRRIATVFCPYLGFTDDDLFDGLKIHFSHAPTPDLIILLGTAAQKEAFRQFRTSPVLLDGLPHLTRYISTPPLVGICLHPRGLQFVEDADAGLLSLTLLEPELRRHGLMHIFTSRRGILESGGAFHYVKPSGKHSDKFVRTANVLIRGAEVHFIAFWLVPHLETAVRHIYTDTAAINTVGQALITMALQTSPDFQCSTVDSFSSYDGLAQFRFEGVNESLVLISASTSGDLDKILYDQYRIQQSHIWTLFYLGPGPEEWVNILCDLKRDEKLNPQGYPEIASYPATDCPLCREGLIPIKIAGDQFLPEGAKISEFKITTRDRPLWLNDFCADFVGKSVIRANFGSVSEAGRVRELFLRLSDVYSVVDSNADAVPARFLLRLDQIISQSVSFTVNRIVYLDDESSPILAQRIYSAIQSRGSAPELKCISAKEIHRDLDAYVTDVGTTLVVAGAVVTGRQLLALSQALRHIQKNRSIQYVIGVARCQSADRLAELKRDLQFGEHGREHYDFRCVQEVWLPDDAPGRVQPWAEERDILLRIREQLIGDKDAGELIEKRLGILDSSSARDGLGLLNELFWPSSSNEVPLRLRPNFAFWRFEYEDQTSQADVYFTIAAILHYRRSGTATRIALTDHEHHRVVLSPRCFDQFNDGVIQASLLRAAHRSELNYSVDSHFSRSMANTLRFFLRNARNQAGEASTEFLLALFGGKLRLAQSDHEEFVKDLGGMEDLQGINRALKLAICKNT